MIHNRRAIFDIGADGPKGTAEVLPPGSFLITFNGVQVPLGATVSAGSILRGTSTTITIRVTNSGASSLDWTSYNFGGTSAAWYTNTDGVATLLPSGDFMDLVFRFSPPANTTAGTYSNEFTMFSDGEPTGQIITFTITHAVTEPEPEPGVEPPVPPTGFTATAGDGYIDYSWTGVSTAQTYQVQGGIQAGGPYATFGHQTADLFKRVTGLTNGTTYYAVVYAQNADTGTSGESLEVACTPVKPPDPDPDPELGTPVISSVAVGPTHCVPRWGAVATATLYYIRVRNLAGTIVADGSTSALTALITGLSPSTAYDVKVSAFNGTIESPESEAYRITTASSGGGPGTPALPREDTMTVYMNLNSWINNPYNNTANIRKAPACSLAGATPMRTYGELVGPVLAAEPSGHRMLMLFHVGTGRTDIPDINTGQTPYSFVESQGYALDSIHKEAFIEFVEGLDCDPEIVALDEENLGYGGAYLLPFWDTLGANGPERAAKFAGIFADETLRKRLPPKLRVSSVAELSLIDNRYLHPNSYLAGEWNQYILSGRAKSLKSVVVDSFVQVRGVAPRYFNYDDERMTRARRRTDGMVLPAANRAMGELTSFPLYITTNTNPWFILGDSWREAAGLEPLTKAPRWNAFISHINTMRGCRNPSFNWHGQLRYDGDNRPFVANPQNAVELLKHAAAMGHREHVWFASTVDSQDEINEYQSIIERIEVGSAPVRRLPAIPLDADSVTTAGVTTTYDEEAWTAGGSYEPVEV